MRGKDWKWNSDFFESQHDSSEYNFVKGLPLTDTVNLVPREEVGAHLQSQGKAPWWRGIDTVVGQTLKLKSSNILHVLFTNLYWPNNLEPFGMNVFLGINTYSQTSLQWRKCAFHNRHKWNWTTQTLFLFKNPAYASPSQVNMFQINYEVNPKGVGGALGYFLGGYVPPGTPNWHPVLEKISPKIDTPF